MEPSDTPTVSFVAFVLTLVRTAAVHLGDVEDPVSGGKQEPDLVAAQQMIDILDMLHKKTQGNLTAEERQFLEQVLYELRMRFVEAKKGEKRIIVP